MCYYEKSKENDSKTITYNDDVDRSLRRLWKGSGVKLSISIFEYDSVAVDCVSVSVSVCVGGNRWKKYRGGGR